MTLPRGIAGRLVAVMLAVLGGYGAGVAWVFHEAALEREEEALQRVSRGLAAHIVGHWPRVAGGDPVQAGREARRALLGMLMAVNPGVQVYVLGADGQVLDYLGEPGMVRRWQVDLDPLRRFMAGARLPLRGDDPMGSGEARLFSAAPLAGAGAGYLYVVLDGKARRDAAQASGAGAAWRGALGAVLIGGLIAGVVGGFTVRRLTGPLRRLAGRMERYDAGPAPQPGRADGDEVRMLERAFDQMTARIERQAAHEREQAGLHRRTLAGVAHDLRTPLTSLHGLLEALADRGGPAEARRPELLRRALAQSDKVRRLSQQLFELAALQAAAELVHRERFRVDELVADSVGMFRAAGAEIEAGLPGTAGPVAAGPGALEVDGDIQLVERALANLIDNARRHGASPAAVTVSLAAEGSHVHIVVADSGPGLPAELQRRLAAGEELRDPPLRRAGGVGGLGLAIAQRVALLHGGSLLPLPAPAGGTRLCLALPRAR